MLAVTSKITQFCPEPPCAYPGATGCSGREATLLYAGFDLNWYSAESVVALAGPTLREHLIQLDDS